MRRTTASSWRCRSIGYDQQRHGGGRAFRWGQGQTLLHLRSQSLRLVNVGATSLVTGARRLGYPVCLVCGQSRSPLASQADRQRFEQDHLERCGRKVGPVGFYADVTADALRLQDLKQAVDAYSLMESLRKGAAQVLEMELEDLQILSVSRPEGMDAFLYDPMPGGSGLLDQLVERFGEVVAAARQVVTTCPGVCARSCVDCLQNFRNAFYHKHLDRHRAAELLAGLGEALALTHELPPLQAAGRGGGEPPVNQPEETLRAMLQRAGFPLGECQRPIDLGRPLGVTRPDLFFDDPDGRRDGVCVYLDGMSRGLHGDPATQRRDRELREVLEVGPQEAVAEVLARLRPLLEG